MKMLEKYHFIYFPQHTDHPLPPHVSHAFDALNTLFTSDIAPHVDLDRETFYSVVLSTFISDILGIDRPSTSGSRDTNAFGSSGGPS
jgi:hypothetical protein